MRRYLRHDDTALLQYVEFLQRSWVILPDCVVGIESNSPAGRLVNRNACQNEENGDHETNRSKAEEAQRRQMQG